MAALKLLYENEDIQVDISYNGKYIVLTNIKGSGYLIINKDTNKCKRINSTSEMIDFINQ